MKLWYVEVDRDDGFDMIDECLVAAPTKKAAERRPLDGGIAGSARAREIDYNEALECFGDLLDEAPLADDAYVDPLAADLLRAYRRDRNVPGTSAYQQRCEREGQARLPGCFTPSDQEQSDEPRQQRETD